MCGAAWLRSGWAAGQSRCSTILTSCFYTYIQLFRIFTPWGQCWNCVHLSSLHTQLELTFAFIFAAGKWVSLTETSRPFRWLLSYSVSLSHSLLLFVCAHPTRFGSPFVCLLISISSFSPVVLFFPHHPFRPPFFHPPPLCLSHSSTPSLWPETDSAVGRRQQTRWSANLLSFPLSIAVCVCMCVCVAQCWIRDRTVIRFPVTACDPKNHDWGAVDSWPGACCRERGDGWDLDIIASSDNMAAEEGQGWEGYCQMYSIIDDLLLIT